MNKKVKLKVLSPVHIGSGDEITPAQYFFYKGKCNILNMTTLLKDKDFKPFFDEYLNKAAMHIAVSEYIPPEILLRNVLYKMDVVGEAVNKLANNAINIKTIVKSAGSAVVPGSSIKGSILSAMVCYILSKECEKDDKIKTIVTNSLREATKGKRFNKNPDLWNNQQMLSHVMSKLGKMGSKNFTSWLRVSDSDIFPVTDSIEIRLAKVEGARSQRGQSKLPIIYEALKAGTEFTVEIDTANCNYPWDKILDALCYFYNAVFDEDAKSHILNNWEPDEDAILLRLGQGSTAFATSMLVLAQDLNIKEYAIKPPKTRKRIDGIPMGWVEIIGDEGNNDG